MKIAYVILTALVGLAYADCHKKPFTPPNIVLIVADDMGFDDISVHGHKQHLTPNIDAVGLHGMVLQDFYTPPMCTPSRGVSITGKYPSHLGLQHYVIGNNEPWGLPENVTTFPDIFKKAGYSTNLVGKWHLGFSENYMLPNNRGYDSFVGYLGAYLDYYQRRAKMPFANSNLGYDYRRNFDLECANRGTYLTELLTTEAEAVIDGHNKNKPLLLTVNHLAPHTANEVEPLQAPQEDISKFGYIQDENRRIYAAMVSKLDESVGNITRALDRNQMLNNTIIIFHSDNGAPSIGMFSNTGSNWPMRGQKNTPWEGAVRVAGVIWSPLLNKRQRIFRQKMYVGDMLPTLASAAKIHLDSNLNLDGLDLWEELSSGNQAPFNREILHVLDDIFEVVSLMKDGFKYIKGTTINGTVDGVLTKRNNEIDPRDSQYASWILNSTVSQVLSKYERTPLTESKINSLRNAARIDCDIQSNGQVECNPLVEECLYKINKDPCERNNLAKLPKYENTLKKMRAAIEKYRSTAMKPSNANPVDLADPTLHDCTWVSYQEVPTKNYTLSCSYTGTPCPDAETKKKTNLLFKSFN